VRRFTAEELARYDGQDGRPAYIACNGKVYDVTGSFLWKGGRHQVLHDAGQALTAELAAAPHGDDLLSRCPLIGLMEEPPPQNRD
jgi:predicted heme/steroid binding protein